MKIPIGRLTRKIHRHESVTSRPPSGAPDDAATAATPAQAPTTRLCWRAGKVGSSRPSEAGHDARRPDRLEQTPEHQHVQRRRDRADDRAGREHDHAAEQESAPAEMVGQAAGGHQQRPEHDRVAVQHPGQIRQPGTVKRPPHRRHRDVDDEQVELGHERDRRQHAQDHPLARVALVGRPARARVVGVCVGRSCELRSAVVGSVIELPAATQPSTRQFDD